MASMAHIRGDTVLGVYKISDDLEAKGEQAMVDWCLGFFPNTPIGFKDGDGFRQCFYPNGDGLVFARKNWPSMGYTWDAARDAFYAPQLYPSWILNEKTCVWEAPIPYPDDGKGYMWDEDLKGWVPV